MGAGRVGRLELDGAPVHAVGVQQLLDLHVRPHVGAQATHRCREPAHRLGISSYACQGSCSS